MHWMEAPWLLSLAAWLYLALGHGRFWRADVRLPAAGGLPAGSPPVAVVVPARDEAAVLPRTLPALLGQRYGGDLRVVLVNDGSTDDTGATARTIARTHPGGDRLHVIDGLPRPHGWTGKPWAQQQGTRAAAGAEWLLLTDADIEHPPDAVARLVAFAQGGNLDVVSVMVRLHVRGRWERLLVPAFVHFFAMLYPFRWVRRRPAAAGGCMLIRAQALRRAGGMQAVRDAIIDDVSLARTLAGAGARLWLGLSSDLRSIRPYPRLADLWQMVARSAYAQLRRSPALLAVCVLGLAVTFLAPPLGLVLGLMRSDPVMAGAAAAAWTLMALTYVPMLRFYGVSALSAPLLPLVAALYLLMTVDSARSEHGGAGVAWKGRRYPAGRSTPDHDAGSTQEQVQRRPAPSA